MAYFDDLINVYAYLYSKSEAVARESLRLSEEACRLEQSFQEMNAQVDDMLLDVDAMLEKAYALAEEMSVDTTGISDQAEAVVDDLPEPVSGKVSAKIRIPLPMDYDFQSEFQKLVQQAHDAGFTDAHPEELLTQAELDQALAFSDELDEAFRRETRLQPKDLGVLLIAVAARVLLHALGEKMSLMIGKSDEEDVPTAQVFAPRKDDASVANPLLEQSLAQDASLSIDAAQGVDISGMLGGQADSADMLKAGRRMANKVIRRFSKQARLLDHETILEQIAPFDIEETELFKRDDIVAYHKYLGWIIGTVNILTDTVTTYGMKSYSINRSMGEWGKPCVSEEISTLFGVINPVMQNAASNKNAIVAATLQEALTQGYGKASPEKVRELFSRAVELENRTSFAAEKSGDMLNIFKAEWMSYIGGVAGTVLLNTIVSAVHAILYEESDGTLDAYSIRTNKIIVYSGAMATVINSLPAIASKNVADLDFSGILTTCLAWFQSTQFWIEAKSEFLSSEYRKILDRELEKLDPYFVVQ